MLNMFSKFESVNLNLLVHGTKLWHFECVGDNLVRVIFI